MFESLKQYMTEAEIVRLTEVPTATAEAPKGEKRRYHGARNNRLTSDWVTGAQTQNQILRMDLRRLRERSRDLARNDPYAKKFLSLIRNNVIGKGMTLQIRPSGKTLASDVKLSSQIENKFYEWSKKEFCTVSGKLSFWKAQRLFVTALARDGEALVRKVYGRNKFGFSLKFYSAAWLDENYNDTLPSGNRVIMSVEVDDDDKPVGYWLTQPIGEYQRRNTTRYRFRVSAAEIIHTFLIDDDEEQTRGVPWLAASMFRLKMFDGFAEAELVGKRVEACQMGFIVPPEDQSAASVADETEPKTGITFDAEPGIFQQLEPGYDVKPFTPKQDSGSSDFKKTTLRGAAAGADVSYHSLAGDLESVNYSSARIGSLEDRDNYEALQTLVIEDFCDAVYKAWLESAYLSGALEINYKDYERVREPLFRPRGWKWVDPLKDAEASVVGLENNFITLTEVLAERGIDLEDFFQTKQKERELAEKYGVDLTMTGRKPDPAVKEE